MGGIRGWPNPHSPRPGNRLRRRQRFRRPAEDRQLDNPQWCPARPVGHRQPDEPALDGRDFLEKRGSYEGSSYPGLGNGVWKCQTGQPKVYHL